MATSSGFSATLIFGSTPDDIAPDDAPSPRNLDVPPHEELDEDSRLALLAPDEEAQMGDPDPSRSRTH
eukprot:13876465-Heterocapsa_arctica.AAC.1